MIAFGEALAHIMSLKRKYATHPTWQRIYRWQYAEMPVAEPEFSGVVALFKMLELREPMYKFVCGVEVCVADVGYAWLHHFPEGRHYSLTTMCDASGAPVQWYVDIALHIGRDPRHGPYLDDLFLDIAVLPSGAREVLDRDELDAALAAGVIGAGEHALAWDECIRVLAEIDAGTFALFERGRAHYAALAARLV
jgi:uncharacterized protein